LVPTCAILIDRRSGFRCFDLPADPSHHARLVWQRTDTDAYVGGELIHPNGVATG